MPQTRHTLPWTLLTLTLIGCSKQPDARLQKMSEWSLQRQAEQNEIIAQQSREATQNTGRMVEAAGQTRHEVIQLQRELVESEGVARKELIAIQQDLVERDADGRHALDELRRHAQSAFAVRTQAIDQQRDLLERERRQIAEERVRAPVVAEAVRFVGGLVVSLTPLVVVVYLLRCLGSAEGVDAATFQVLIDEITSDQPRLLRARTPSPDLPSPSADSRGP